MEGESFEKSMKGMSTALRKVGTKAIPSHIFHFMFVGEGRNGARGVVSVEGFVEKDEVGETAADAEAGLLKRFKIRLGEDISL